MLHEAVDERGDPCRGDAQVLAERGRTRSRIHGDVQQRTGIELVHSEVAAGLDERGLAGVDVAHQRETQHGRLGTGSAHLDHLTLVSDSRLPARYRVLLFKKLI